MNKNTIIKLVCSLAAIVIIFTSLTRLLGGNSLTLTEYAKENPEALQTKETTPTVTDGDSSSQAAQSKDSDSQNSTKPPSTGDSANTQTSSGEADNTSNAADKLPGTSNDPNKPQLIGASLNGDTMLTERITFTAIPSDTQGTASFYYEPLSDHLRRYITGITYPQTEEPIEITYDDLRYLHIIHYDFEGKETEGELICNKSIAQDLMEIFHELYQNQYQIEKVRLIDEYEGDDTASMEDNNTSCFNYRQVDGTTSLSKHALGLAIDINPYYNPYVTYTKTNETKVSPAGAEQYADRTSSFPYKIDESDLCYKLFKEHGFTWGGNWNSLKDYQHFQKVQ